MKSKFGKQRQLLNSNHPDATKASLGWFAPSIQTVLQKWRAQISEDIQWGQYYIPCWCSTSVLSDKIEVKVDAPNHIEFVLELMAAMRKFQTSDTSQRWDAPDEDKGIQCFDRPEGSLTPITADSRTQMGRVKTKTVSELAYWTACLALTWMKHQNDERCQRYIEDVKAILWQEVIKALKTGTKADFFRDFAQCLDLKCNGHEWNNRQKWLLNRLFPNEMYQTVFLTRNAMIEELKKENLLSENGGDNERTISKDLKRIGAIAKNSPRRRRTAT